MEAETLKTFLKKYIIVIGVVVVVLLVLLALLVSTLLKRSKDKSNNTSNTTNTTTSKTDVEIAFATASGSASVGQEVSANLLASVSDDSKVSGVTTVIKYPTDKLEFLQDKSSDSLNQGDTECRKNNFKLDTVARVTDEAGTVKMTKVSLHGDDQLATGKFCLSTLYFKVKPGATGSAAISLENKSDWLVVSTVGNPNPKIGTPASFTVTVK